MTYMRDEELATQLKFNMKAACEAMNELVKRGWNITADFKFTTQTERTPYLYIHREIEL